MESQTTKPETQHTYPTNAWSSTTTTASDSTPAAQTSTDRDQDQAAGGTVPFPSHLEFLPFWFPQQSNIYHAQLLHYNKLISPARGGGGLQTGPLPPVVSSPHVQASPRSRTSSKASQRDSASGKGSAQGGHGNRSNQSSDKNRSAVNSSKETPSKMPSKSSSTEPTKTLPARSAAISSSPQGQSHSSSVPSTPHQHARKFSFESRDPSPNAATNHSPRSAYSETNSTLPSLRPLPPRLGGCKYETAQINSRRRIPYSVGSDRLEKLDPRTIKNKLTDKEEEKLAKEMREIFNKLLPTDKIEENRKKLVEKLEKIFNDEWPGHDIKVHLFGSSGNLLCSDDSDVDICITTPWKELEGVCMIANLLAKRGMEKVVCISAAKVPIVKIWDPELGLACDMNVNNTVALENTRMVRTYVETDPRVRKLAMVIKYWTRKRIINDAAFGGTLSSYTWICLIITFLQLRQPPVLPALHQLPYKMPRPDGSVGEFADNLKKLKGFGGKNKSSDAELLFQFFRFYAHEFDYNKHVLSVRQGKLITKTEKKWNYAINNQLCVEEPFNIARNLGNTADEYSFRGLHLEIRRAFDLLSIAKLDEACEQFVFPKEEERVWSRPPQQPRPAMIRSSSQSHAGRGGRGNHRGGGRHNNYHRGGGGGGGGGGSSRRASSSVPAYDGTMLMPGLAMPQDLAWYQASQVPFQYAQQDLMAQIAYQENMRQLHLYAQSPAFLQHQQNLAQQRLSASSASSQQSPSDRSRTNSFDNAPANGLLRPELYAMYGMSLSPQFYAQSQGAYGTYPSSPSTTQGSAQDFRRPLQRSATDAGVTTAGSSLRSQSQPASRSPVSTPFPPYPLSTQTSNTSYFTARSPTGVPIPNFMPDDTDFDETPKATNETLTSDEVSASHGSVLAGRSPSPVQSIQQPSVASSIAFGDISGTTDLENHGLTQDGIGKGTATTTQTSSRGHGRALSAGTASAPLPSRPFADGQVSTGPPLVVNGSGMKTNNTVLSGSYASTVPVDNLITDMNNALRIHEPSAPSAKEVVGQQIDSSERPQIVTAAPSQANALNPSAMLPMAEDASFRERIAMMNSYYASGMNTVVAQGNSQVTSQQRILNRHPQSGLIAPLDLAISSDSRLHKGHPIEAAHLSPVYETRTPSPTTQRKSEAPSFAEKLSGKQNGRSTRLDANAAKQSHAGDRALQPQDNSKAAKQAKAGTPQTPRTNTHRENGHIRSAKSESDGGWQKAGGKNKKKATNTANQASQSEQPPKHEADRKGG